MGHFFCINYLFWLRWVFIAACGLSLVAASRGWLLFSCGAGASHCSGFFCCRAQALGHTSFSSCGTWAPELWLV